MSNSGRLIGAVNFIGRIIVIWLTFRVANLTRKNADTILMHKIVSSAFGLIILAGTSISLIQAKATWVITAYNHELLEPRREFSGGFIGYVGTTTLTVKAPSAMGMVFLAGVALVILSINWTPKKSYRAKNKIVEVLNNVSPRSPVNLGFFMPDQMQLY